MCVRARANHSEAVAYLALPHPQELPEAGGLCLYSRAGLDCCCLVHSLFHLLYWLGYILYHRTESDLGDKRIANTPEYLIHYSILSEETQSEFLN